MEITVRPLNPEHIQQANRNSMNGKRGDLSAGDYESSCNLILSWPISDEKKQTLLDALYKKWSEKLSHEARHISVMVAGPARYDARKLDHGDTVLRLGAEIAEWLKELEEQIRQGTRNTAEDPDRLEERIRFCDERPELDPTTELVKLSSVDNARFIRLFEELYPKYKWRKNSNMYKLYELSKAGQIKEIRRETFYEDANFTAYTEGDRAYIRFLMRPKRQLIVALKSRGWWWNSRVDAWSTYLDRLDREWVGTISERYAAYL